MINLCAYEGMDTTAAVGSNDDGSWFARCHCGELACESGTYDEAIQALDAHRSLALGD